MTDDATTHAAEALERIATLETRIAALEKDQDRLHDAALNLIRSLRGHANHLPPAVRNSMRPTINVLARLVDITKRVP